MSHRGSHYRRYPNHCEVPDLPPGPRGRWLAARVAMQLAWDRREISLDTARLHMSQLDATGPDWGGGAI